MDEMVLDLGVYRHIQFVTEHGIHDVHKQLKKIADALDRWSAGSCQGIRVVRDDERKDHALAVRHFRTRPESGFAHREACVGDGPLGGAADPGAGEPGVGALASEKVDSKP